MQHRPRHGLLALLPAGPPAGLPAASLLSSLLATLLAGEDTPAGVKHQEELLLVIVGHPYGRVLQTVPSNLNFLKGLGPSEISGQLLPKDIECVSTLITFEPLCLVYRTLPPATMVLFMSSESLPLVIEFYQDTAQEICSGEIKPHPLAFLSAKAESHADDMAMIADIAKDHKRTLYLKLLTVNLLVGHLSPHPRARHVSQVQVRQHLHH